MRLANAYRPADYNSPAWQYPSGLVTGKAPRGTAVAGQGQLAKFGPEQFNRDRPGIEHGVVELLLGHGGRDQFVVERDQLFAADHVAGLVERGNAVADVPSHFADRAETFVADVVDEELDHLVG